MRPLFRKLHGKGKVLSIWVAPGAFDKESGKLQHPAIVLKIKGNSAKATFALSLEEATELHKKLEVALTAMARRDIELMEARDAWIREQRHQNSGGGDNDGDEVVEEFTI